VEVEIRVSQRARRARIELPPGRGPLLVVPRGTSERQIGRLLDRWTPWVERQLSRRRPAPPLADRTEAECRALVRAEAERIAREEGLAPTRIRIAGQRTRWGSCAPSGTVSLNWRLALAPPAVLDYVVIHELCHLGEANHGPRFWALVEQHRPGYRAARRWLGDNGHALLAHEPGQVDSGAWSAGRPSTATAR
jgi:predicted metal-dependent hydrolase